MPLPTFLTTNRRSSYGLRRPTSFSCYLSNTPSPCDLPARSPRYSLSSLLGRTGSPRRSTSSRDSQADEAYTSFHHPARHSVDGAISGGGRYWTETRPPPEYTSMEDVSVFRVPALVTLPRQQWEEEERREDVLPPYPPLGRRRNLEAARAFGSPDDATCMIRVPEAGDFHVHRAFLAPYSAVFRDLLDPHVSPEQETVRMRAGPEVLYWVMRHRNENENERESMQDGERDGDGEGLFRIVDNGVEMDVGIKREGTRTAKRVSFSNMRTWPILQLPTFRWPTRDTTRLYSLRTSTTKFAFWAHLAKFNSHYASPSPSSFTTATSYFLRRQPTTKKSTTAHPRPILYIHVPSPAMFPALLEWLYTGSWRELFAGMENAACGCERAFFGVLKNVKELEVVEEVYEVLAVYLLTHPDITVSEPFCKASIPFPLLRSFMARSNWTNTDKLAVLLWWVRFESTPPAPPSTSSTTTLASQAVHIPSSSTTSLLHQLCAASSLRLGAGGDENQVVLDEEMELLTLYIDVLEISPGETEEMREMLPEAFDRLVQGGIRTMMPRRNGFGSRNCVYGRGSGSSR